MPSRPLFRASRLGIALLLAGCLSLNACMTSLDKLESIGQQPRMSKVVDPTTAPGYKPITWPTPETPAPQEQYANSLWQPGARAFFRDQRAQRVGDILRVNINLQERAQLNNRTQRERKVTENLAAPDIFGMENQLFKALPGKADPSSLLDVKNNDKNEGIGIIQRQDNIRTQVAATVLQVLPNGNLVIDGKQEIRVNFEVREVGVQGIVRREDIKADNTVDLSQVAEARVIYGGRGQITDIQQPRWGAQVVDVLSPF